MGNNILTTTTTIIITTIIIQPGAKKTVARPAPIVHEQGETDQGDEDVVKDDHWLRHQEAHSLLVGDCHLHSIHVMI